jgi:anthranilate/para-aminobenzoate synthase component II
MRTLLIDDDDSWTCNLFHLPGEVNGEEPVVVHNGRESGVGPAPRPSDRPRAG